MRMRRKILGHVMGICRNFHLILGGYYVVSRKGVASIKSRN